MRIAALLIFVVAVASMAIAALGLNKARTPNGAYGAALLGVAAIITLLTAALTLWFTRG
jgi:hypothetical protein